MLTSEREAFSINYADICIRWGLYESALRYVGWPIIPGFDLAGAESSLDSKSSRYNCLRKFRYVRIAEIHQAGEVKGIANSKGCASYSAIETSGGAAVGESVWSGREVVRC